MPKSFLVNRTFLPVVSGYPYDARDFSVKLSAVLLIEEHLLQGQSLWTPKR